MLELSQSQVDEIRALIATGVFGLYGQQVLSLVNDWEKLQERIKELERQSEWMTSRE